MNTDFVKVVCRCPACHQRVFDKVTPSTGVITIKCPRCNQIVTIDLSLRRRNGRIHYRKMRRAG